MEGTPVRRAPPRAVEERESESIASFINAVVTRSEASSSASPSTSAGREGAMSDDSMETSPGVSRVRRRSDGGEERREEREDYTASASIRRVLNMHEGAQTIEKESSLPPSNVPSSDASNDSLPPPLSLPTSTSTASSSARSAGVPASPSHTREEERWGRDWNVTQEGRTERRAYQRRAREEGGEQREERSGGGWGGGGVKSSVSASPILTLDDVKRALLHYSIDGGAFLHRFEEDTQTAKAEAVDVMSQLIFKVEAAERQRDEADARLSVVEARMKRKELELSVIEREVERKDSDHSERYAYMAGQLEKEAAKSRELTAELQRLQRLSSQSTVKATAARSETMKREAELQRLRTRLAKELSVAEKKKEREGRLFREVFGKQLNERSPADQRMRDVLAGLENGRASLLREVGDLKSQLRTAMDKLREAEGIIQRKDKTSAWLTAEEGERQAVIEKKGAELEELSRQYELLNEKLAKSCTESDSLRKDVRMHEGRIGRLVEENAALRAEVAARHKNAVVEALEAKVEELETALVHEKTLSSRRGMEAWSVRPGYSPPSPSLNSYSITYAASAEEKREVKKEGTENTRQKMKEDKANHRLRLYDLRTLPVETLRESLKAICRELNVSEITAIVPIVADMKKAIKKASVLDRFSRDVAAVVLNSDEHGGEMSGNTANMVVSKRKLNGYKMEMDERVCERNGERRSSTSSSVDDLHRGMDASIVSSPSTAHWVDVDERGGKGGERGEDGKEDTVAITLRVLDPAVAEMRKAIIRTLRLWQDRMSELEVLRDFVKELSVILKGRVKFRTDEHVQARSQLPHHAILSEVKNMVSMEAEERSLRDRAGALEVLMEGESASDTAAALLKHFQQLFNVKAVTGILPTMNRLYVRAREVEGVVGVLKELLGLDENESMARVVDTVKSLVDEQH